MTLTLTMLRCPEAVAPETRELRGGEFSIGRGSENDWILPDPERFLSKQHCLFAYRAGGWQVADLSTNGTFLNHESEPIGRDRARDLRSGDRLRLGPYEIEVQIAAAAEPRQAPSAAADSFSLDPFATPPPRAGIGPLAADPLLRERAGEDPFGSELAPASINLPADYNPLDPEPSEERFAGPVAADHSPHIEDAFAAPAARAVLPDDWDREASAAPVSPAATPPPVAVAASPPPTEAPLPAAPGEDLLAAFLRGTGLTELRPADPAAAMEALGAAFRATVSGLRQAIIARAAVKGEFRIEPTRIRTYGNNPLKFSADDDDALAALLGAGRRTDMNAAEAIADALRDLRLHELASLAAMQSAVRALLAELDPDKLRRAGGQGGFGFVSAQRKAHAWDAFAALHAKITQALTDDFDSVFGKAFARAYERALAEVSAKDAER